MTSSNNGIEIDEICFETLFPEQNYQLPKYGEETPIKLGFRITNNSSTPYRFQMPYFLVEISNYNGERMKINLLQNSTRTADESDIPLIYPGKSVEFWLRYTKFSWYEYERDCIILNGYSLYGAIWTFYGFKPGKYNIRLRYENSQSINKIPPGLQFREYDCFWIGKVFTPWKTMYLR